MGGPLRIEYPGALYQVTSRGNERKDIFLDDGVALSSREFSRIIMSVMALLFMHMF